MNKKTRNEVDEERAKSKGMKMKDELHDMDDICEMDDFDEVCDIEDNECATDMEAEFPDCIMLAHAYVPWQFYEKAFSPSEALSKGTLFPELWGVYPIPR